MDVVSWLAVVVPVVANLIAIAAAVRARSTTNPSALRSLHRQSKVALLLVVVAILPAVVMAATVVVNGYGADDAASRGALLAQGISEGINCLAALVVFGFIPAACMIYLGSRSGKVSK